MKQQTGRTLLWRVLLAAVAVAATVFTIVDNGALAPLYYTSWSVWFATLTALGGL